MSSAPWNETDLAPPPATGPRKANGRRPARVPHETRGELVEVETRSGANDAPSSRAAGPSKPRRERPRRTREDDGDQDDDARPVVQFEPDQLGPCIDTGIASLRGDASLYVRGDDLAHVMTTTMEEEDRDPGTPEGSPRIRELPLDALRERLARLTRWRKWDARAGDWVACVPPSPVLGAIARRGEWPGLRQLVGIAEAPLMRPDGRIVDVPGYDPQTRYLYAPAIAFPKIADQPTPDEARDALAALGDVFADFPYALDAGRSAAVASVLTLVARAAIRGPTPAFLFNATSPGSGKTLQTDVASMIAFGRHAGRKNFPTDERNADEELNKVLGAYAMSGAPLINFDNVSDSGAVAFGGSAIEGPLTAADTADFRVLGESTIKAVPWRTVIFGSGNNIVVGRDALRRVLLITIETPHESPESRPLEDFKHPERAFGLVPWVQAHRAELVASALTLLRGYHVAGRPKVKRTKQWASYEAWTALVANAIVWAGGADPLECRPEGDAENPEKRLLGVVLRDWPKLDTQARGLAIKTALAALYPRERMRGEVLPPDGFDDLREALETLAGTPSGRAPDARRVYDVFRRYRRSVRGGKALDTTSTDHGGAMRWTVVSRGYVATSSAGGDP